MTELEQKIWEACGSPTRYTPIRQFNRVEVEQGVQMITSELGEFQEPIDITLAHVMQLLHKKHGVSFVMDYPYLIIKAYDARNNLTWEIYWWLILENNEAALFRDQSIETQTAIAKVAAVL